MISNVFNDKDCLRIFADDQCWDDATLKQLKEEYNIIFMTNSDGAHPIMIKGKWLIIGWEDDGQIGFDKRYGRFTNSFDKFWVPYLIADLKEAAKYIDEKNKLGG